MTEIPVLITEADISARVAGLAREIEAYIGNGEAVIIANLKGSFIFFSDLVRAVKKSRVLIDFISTESYAGTSQSGTVRITRDLTLDLKGRRVVLVDDILDTGLTLSHLIRYLKEVRDAQEVFLCVLLDKPARRRVPVEVNCRGFTIDDQFVVGYGLDYNEYYRNLPYVGVLPDETDRKTTRG